METFCALLALCAGNSPVTGEFPAQRPVTQSFDVSFDLRLNKRLSKQSWGRWFETPSCPLWCHCNGLSGAHGCAAPKMRCIRWDDMKMWDALSVYVTEHYVYILIGHSYFEYSTVIDGFIISWCTHGPQTVIPYNFPCQNRSKLHYYNGFHLVLLLCGYSLKLVIRQQCNI